MYFFIYIADSNYLGDGAVAGRRTATVFGWQNIHLGQYRHPGGRGGTPPVCYNLTTPLAKAFQCWHSDCSFETSACRLLTSNESLIPSRESCLCLLPSPSLLTIPSCSLSSDSLSLTISCCKNIYIIIII